MPFYDACTLYIQIRNVNSTTLLSSIPTTSVKNNSRIRNNNATRESIYLKHFFYDKKKPGR